MLAVFIHIGFNSLTMSLNTTLDQANFTWEDAFSSLTRWFYLSVYLGLPPPLKLENSPNDPV